MPQDVEEHNKKVLETLEIGDLVEVPGKIYSHWAVYIGMYQIFTNVLCSICIPHLINKICIFLWPSSIYEMITFSRLDTAL